MFSFPDAKHSECPSHFFEKLLPEQDEEREDSLIQPHDSRHSQSDLQFDARVLPMNLHKILLLRFHSLIWAHPGFCMSSRYWAWDWIFRLQVHRFLKYP